MASQPTAVLAGLPRPGMMQHPNGQLTQSPIAPPQDATPPQGPPQKPLPNGSGPQQSPRALQQQQPQQQQQQQQQLQQQQQQPQTQQQQPQQQQSQELIAFQTLQSENAETWLAIGKLAEIMGDFDRAVASYDASLRNNAYSIPTLRAIANLYRGREMFDKAVDYYNSILALNQHSGETWGSLGMFNICLLKVLKAVFVFSTLHLSCANFIFSFFAFLSRPLLLNDG